MHRRIRGWFAALTLAALTVVLPARAELVVGREYVPIVPAQASDNPAKLEVIEFFSYGCPHCSEFHPTVSKWSAALPGDVVFKRVPISFARPQWASLAAILAALTMFVGNFAALRQTNIKRLLAYSSIAHAGYILMALPPAGQPFAAQSDFAVGSAPFYLMAYALTTLGAWAVVMAVESSSCSSMCAASSRPTNTRRKSNSSRPCR